MTDSIQLGDLVITVTRKDVKHVHLSVHPPNGRVTLVAPRATRLEVAHAYAATRLGWIRAQQERFRGQARETPRRFVEQVLLTEVLDEIRKVLPIAALGVAQAQARPDGVDGPRRHRCARVRVV